MKKIISSGLVLMTVVAAVVVGTGAFFSDTEVSNDNRFESGMIDLQIDNESYYNGVLNESTSWNLKNLETGDYFFNFSDLKPGDLGEDTISLHVTNNPAWACMNLSLTNNDEVGAPNEPELVAGDDPVSLIGELAENLQFIFWSDDGDNVLEIGEETILEGTGDEVLNASWPLADSQTSNISGLPDGSPLDGTSTYYIAKAWCYGNLSLAPVAQDTLGKTGTNGPTSPRGGGVSCDGSLVTNISQTDLVMADVEFTAIQSRNISNFLCSPDATPTPSPSPSPSPTPLACVEVWASSVESSSQGVRKNGTAVLATRSTPTTGLVAETIGLPFDPAPAEGTFFSLGFKNNGATPGGEIIVGFSTPFFNGPGDDLRIFEVTGGPPYPDEKIKVDVGPSNIGPWTAVSASMTKDGSIDLGLTPSAQFVRITDISDISLFETTADAYDLDGVRALCATAPLDQ